MTVRAAGQDATDFSLPDATVSRFLELRDAGAAAAEIGLALELDGELVDELVRADESWQVAHRIATGELPMYPPPEPHQRVIDTRMGNELVPIVVVLVIVVAAIAYGLLR